MNLEKVKEFPISIYSFEKGEVLSKARARIFYLGANRNASFITDAFAEKLLSSIPYTPVKGIYENEDYSDHGESRSEGKIYGIVPENPNLKWETHQDEDGVYRDYACVDVLLFTAIYPEAQNIVGKSLSMELHQPSLMGAWKNVDGQQLYVFTEGSFLGLQVLGEGKEPCFEGASFFTLISLLEQFVKGVTVPKVDTKKGGQPPMEVNFKLSYEETDRKLWEALNPEVDETGVRISHYWLVDTFEDYAIVLDNDNKFYKVAYTISEEDEIELGDLIEVEKLFVSAEEKLAIEALRSLNGGTYEKIEDVFSLGLKFDETVAEKDALYEEKVSEFEAMAESLKDLQETHSTLETDLAATNESLEQLQSYKKAIEDAEKESVFSRYSEQLDSEIITKYRDVMDSYTLVELEKELAYELVQSQPSIFAQDEDLVQPKPIQLSGLAAILSSYEKKQPQR